MSDPIEILAVYLYLAVAAGKRLQMPDRDRLLVISTVNACHCGLPLVAAYCRRLILENNPGHMLRRWSSTEQALKDSDFLHFLKQIQRRFPQEKAETMLQGLGIDRANERALYFSDEEYASAILGVKRDWLAGEFAHGDAKHPGEPRD
jgi:hypothetical protein